MRQRRKWQRLDWALGVIGPDDARRARALEVARAAVLEDVGADLEQGVYRTTPHDCRVWQWQRPDGVMVTL